MKMFRRFFAMLTACASAAICGAAIPLNASAADTMYVVGDELFTMAGDVVAFSVSAENNIGICNAGIVLNYDSRLKPLMSEEGAPIYQNGSIIDGYYTQGALNADIQRISFVMSGTADLQTDGTLFTVYFEIPRDAAPGTSYGVSVNAKQMLDHNNVNRIESVQTADGVITVGGDFGKRISPNEMLFRCEDAEAQAGSIIAVPVEVVQNKGFAAGGIRLFYDERLEPVMQNSTTVKTEKGDASEFLIVLPYLNTKEHIVGVTTMGGANATADGTVFTAYFKVPEDAKAGDTYDLRVDVNYLEAADKTNLLDKTVTENATITVADAKLMGDVNVNGKVEIGDAILLSRYTADDPVEVSDAGIRNADMNGDGMCSFDDVVNVLQTIAHII